MTIISNDVIIAYRLCPRKAYLLKTAEQLPAHPYVALLEDMKDRAKAKVAAKHSDALRGINFDPTKGLPLFVDVILQHGHYEAVCDVLSRSQKIPNTHQYLYEPTIVVGTCRLTAHHKFELAYVGYVLGQLQHQTPPTGSIIDVNGNTHQIKLSSYYGEVENTIRSVRGNLTEPPVFLIDHCACCQFHATCAEIAEKEDSLSLLSRMTPKIARKYHKKGVFTVNQLSFIFRPRRSRKRRANANVHFKFELQALAIRTAQIYVQHTPELPKKPVELFLDVEGVPDQRLNYLVGLLICEGDKTTYHSFWADRREDELKMWQEALALMQQYPEAPIYHYGHYEQLAIDRFMKTHRIDCLSVKARLSNVNSMIYGKVYFPTRSNGLKDLARQLGFAWTSSDATGLQSLVWRQQWEDTRSDEYKKFLITYNNEDCQALRILTEELRRIGEEPGPQKNVEFAEARKRKATPVGEEIHKQFDAILRSAHADYDAKKISVKRPAGDEEALSNKRGGQPGHRGVYRRVPKAARVVRLPPAETCPNCPGVPLRDSVSGHFFERTVIDLVFAKSGCRKSVTRYKGTTICCPSCGRDCRDESIDAVFESGPGLRFGHSLRSWVVYQRIVLRLSYNLIVQAMVEQFQEPISSGTIVEIIKSFGLHYAKTEQLNVERLLASPFIHADETKINIQGTEQFVWVFTDGRHVVFRLTETREAEFVHQFLEGYAGVLVTDFYSGYDGVKCRQQKCLVHLIRDLNNDLWHAPFDREFEAFVAEVQQLLLPILEAIRKYGLKTRHLRKYEPLVDRFYAKNVDGKTTTNELVGKYQKRFLRYKASLFVFLQVDDVSWHNNTAENAIRPLAVLRKISGYFFKSVAPRYLVLLGIAQTCKYQDTSFLQFLLSRETDIDIFMPGRRTKSSARTA